VAGGGARFFNDTEDLEEILFSLARDPQQLAEMEEASRRRYQEEFNKEKVLAAYEDLLIEVGQKFS
jgi:glycosyltransferase involved in cell wall biosynthesis